MASVAETGGLLQSGDPVKISFTNTDKARVGVVTLPDGATFYAQGGPNFRVEGHDPMAGVDSAGYASAKKGTAQRHHSIAAAGAEFQFPINNSDLNTLASNGILAVKASVENAIVKNSLTPGDLLAHIKRSVTAYNGTEIGRKSPMQVPSSVAEFMAAVDSLGTFPERIQFAKNFYSKSRKTTDAHTFGAYDDVANAINEPSFADRGANDITNVLRVNPEGKTSKTTGHEIYPWSIEAKNFGKTATGDIMEIVPKSFWDEIAALEKTRGKKYTDNQAKALIGQWLWFGNNKLAPGKILTVPAENVAKFFLQESKGVIKGWYDASTKTLGAFTGKSDFSTFVHESFHAWTSSLKPEHIAALERQYGKFGSTEFFEKSARAFERYLRDGVAPTESLRGVFATVKDAMVRIYSKIKGSPIESKVHADVKTVFDEMLGG